MGTLQEAPVENVYPYFHRDTRQDSQGYGRNQISCPQDNYVKPDNAVRPPAWIFTTVPIVAPAPAIPPNRPDIKLPKPCPINSLSESCCVRVRLSATIEVEHQYSRLMLMLNF
jgi:hypothetical protein